MSEGQPAPDASRWVDEHGDALYRYALGRVGRADVAEDMVQETFLAALRAAGGFAGRSSERTWLTGILKNKLIDRLRREGRTRAATDLGVPDDWLDGLYDATGHWRSPPGAWGADPAALLERREFWEAFERCRAGLPDRLREVLSLRLLDGVPAPELCAALGITANNLWTLLHRARVRLWQCLDRQGLGPLPGGGKA
jgi:RNA polymerase sigma-70 factor (ECF subfamily)